jgi:hypothetical protein
LTSDRPSLLGLALLGIVPEVEFSPVWPSEAGLRPAPYRKPSRRRQERDREDLAELVHRAFPPPLLLSSSSSPQFEALPVRDWEALRDAIRVLSTAAEAESPLDDLVVVLPLRSVEALRALGAVEGGAGGLRVGRARVVVYG